MRHHFVKWFLCYTLDIYRNLYLSELCLTGTLRYTVTFQIKVDTCREAFACAPLSNQQDYHPLDIVLSALFVFTNNSIIL